jgi:signal peptidase I
MERRRRKKKARQEMWAMIRELLIAFAIVLLIKTFLFEIITVNGGSMLDTLHSGDKLYVSILTPRINGYERGDVVICYYPGRTDRCVKRIIALPGETVEIRSGTVYVNGEMLQEDYITHTAGYNYPQLTLSEKEYFVLGDNRPISHDSHSADVGPVTRIEGEVRFIFWPLDRFGTVK